MEKENERSKWLTQMYLEMAAKKTLGVRIWLSPR